MGNRSQVTFQLPMTTPVSSVTRLKVSVGSHLSHLRVHYHGLPQNQLRCLGNYVEMLTQASRGIRERVFLKKQASGLPFDNGEFALVEEPIHSPLAENDPLRFTADRIQWSDSWGDRWWDEVISREAIAS